MTKANNDIKINDMVMVVKGKPCCAFTGGKLGLTYVVKEIKYINGTMRCKQCKADVHATFVIGNGGMSDRKMHGFQITQVIKVNPPPVDESLDTTTKEPIHERL